MWLFAGFGFGNQLLMQIADRVLVIAGMFIQSGNFGTA